MMRHEPNLHHLALRFSYRNHHIPAISQMDGDYYLTPDYITRTSYFCLLRRARGHENNI